MQIGRKRKVFKNGQTISIKQAIDCEFSKVQKRCLCRCQGEFHGANRKMSELPASDPHIPSSRCPLCEGTGRTHFYKNGVMKPDKCRTCNGLGQLIVPGARRNISEMEAALARGEEWVQPNYRDRTRRLENKTFTSSGERQVRLELHRDKRK